MKLHSVPTSACRLNFLERIPPTVGSQCKKAFAERVGINPSITDIEVAKGVWNSSNETHIFFTEKDMHDGTASRNFGSEKYGDVFHIDQDGDTIFTWGGSPKCYQESNGDRYYHILHNPARKIVLLGRKTGTDPFTCLGRVVVKRRDPDALLDATDPHSLHPIVHFELLFAPAGFRGLP